MATRSLNALPSSHGIIFLSTWPARRRLLRVNSLRTRSPCSESERYPRTNLSHQIKYHTVIVATGVTVKRLRLPQEDELWSLGISACAICDGASPLFKGQVLTVVGGGDTATEEVSY